jgi:hypothetical protein
LEPFCFGLFGDFIPKGENVRQKQARFQGFETKGGNVNIGIEDQKRGEGSRGSLDDGKHPSKCMWF